MQRLIVLIFIGIFMLFGCEKYNLKQPAYLDLYWKYFSTTSAQGNVEVLNGNFYATDIVVSGKRVKGNDIEIRQDFGSQNVAFGSNTSLNVSLDVPMGDYTDFELKIGLDTEQADQIFLNGKVQILGEELPFQVIFKNMNEISFDIMNPFSIEKKESYKLYLGLDVNQLVSTISDIQWKEATVSQQSGVPTIVIQDGLNTQMYNEIKDQVSASLKLSIE